MPLSLTGKTFGDMDDFIRKTRSLGATGAPQPNSLLQPNRPAGSVFTDPYKDPYRTTRPTGPIFTPPNLPLGGSGPTAPTGDLLQNKVPGAPVAPAKQTFAVPPINVPMTVGPDVKAPPSVLSTFIPTEPQIIEMPNTVPAPVMTKKEPPVVDMGSPMPASLNNKVTDQNGNPVDVNKVPPVSLPPSESNVPSEPATPGKSDVLYDSVLDHLTESISSDEPLPGTAAAIRQRREALAQYAKNAEARAGAMAARGGSLGQGTANTMALDTRQDILSHLADAELDNVQAVSAEKQSLINQATQVGQFGKTFDQRKSEFEKTFGAEQAALYRNQLERLAVDNPVLATKLTNYLLEGKTGALGAFSPAELQQMRDYTAKKQGQQDKLTEVMNKVLENLGKDVDKAANPAPTPGEQQQTALDKAVAGKDLKSLTQADWSEIMADPNKLRQVEGAGLLPKVASKDVQISDQDSSRNIDRYKSAYSDLTPGKHVLVNGVPYEIIAVGEVSTRETDSVFANTRNRMVTRARNLVTGKEENILASAQWDPD